MLVINTAFNGSSAPVNVNGCTFTYGLFDNSHRGPFYQQRKGTYTNCTFQATQGSYGLYTDGTNSIDVVNCKFINCGITGSAAFNVTGSTLTGPNVNWGFYHVNSTGCVVDNCVIDIRLFMQNGLRRLVFKNHNKFLRAYSAGTGTKTTEIYLISGGTLSFFGNRVATSTTPVSIDAYNGFIRVVENPLDATPSGTFTIITTSGNTITVSGEGTYLNSDGTHNIS